MSEQFKALTEGMAAVVEKAAQSVVQVNGRRRLPASGIVWSADGVIVTANHVVRTETIRVGLPGGEQVEATLIGRDPALILQRYGSNATHLPQQNGREKKSCV